MDIAFACHVFPSSLRKQDTSETKYHILLAKGFNSSIHFFIQYTKYSSIYSTYNTSTVLDGRDAAINNPLRFLTTYLFSIKWRNTINKNKQEKLCSDQCYDF